MTISSSPAAGISLKAGLPPFVTPASQYIAGRSYSSLMPGAQRSSTNANVMTSDLMYGVIGYINAPVNINAMGFRTSSSNASAGASVKFAIYNLDSNLNPTNLIQKTTTGVAVTDSAVSTAFSQTLDAVAVLQPGNYLFCILPTFVTTAVKTCTYANTSPWEEYIGATSLANALNGIPICGYTATAVYAAGFPANFTDNSAATAITGTASSAGNQTPFLGFTAT